MPINYESVYSAKKSTPLRLFPNYIYLYHLDEFVILPTYPDQIQDAMSSTFQETNALSRSSPVFSYSYSGPRTVQISLELHRDMLDGVNLDASNLKIEEIGDDYLDSLIKKLQAMSLPVYNGESKSVEPPMIAVRFGSEIFIKGVIKGQVSVRWAKPLVQVGNEEKYVKADISFTVYEVDPYDAITVAEKGSFRGLTRTNNIYK